MRYAAFAAAAAIAVAVALPFDLALAADGTIVSASPLWDMVNGYITPLLVPIAAIIVGWLANLVRKKLGLDIEASHRDALQTALVNAAGLVLQKVGSRVATLHLDVHSEVVADAVDYVLGAVPQAAAKFGLSPEDIAEKILAKLPQIAPPPAVTPIAGPSASLAGAGSA